jgi:hypothetical protein
MLQPDIDIDKDALDALLENHTITSPPNHIDSIFVDAVDLKVLRKEHARVLAEWFEEREDLQRQVGVLKQEALDLKLAFGINPYKVTSREEIKQRQEDIQGWVENAVEILKYIEEQSRKDTMVVVGAPIREVVCNSLNAYCKKFLKNGQFPD